MNDLAFVLLPQLTVQVVADDTGRPLQSLFVLYRPALPAKQAKKSNAVLDYIAGLWSDKERAARRPFRLAKTDACGFLQHAKGHEPLSLAPLMDPSAPVESLKLGQDVAYEMHFVRHPDPAYSEAALQEVNGAKPAAITREWPAAAVMTPRIERCPMIDAHQLKLRVGSKPELYRPAGDAAYGGWVLFKDMPHADVLSVKQAVEKLQIDLGKLRYVIGAEPPYEPERPAKDKKGNITNTATINQGVFDARTMSAVLDFQRQMLARHALQVDKAKAHDMAIGATGVAASWAYVTGTAATPDAIVPQAGGVALKPNGVCDGVTARAIAAWIANGFRHPRAVLVAVPAMDSRPDWNTWVRPEAAESLLAWRKLARALGHPEGICASHTYRTPLTDVGKAAFGRSAVSIHKTGLAIDLLHDGQTRKPRDRFMVLIQKDHEDKQTRNGVHIGDRVYWRLFGATKVPLDPARAVDAVCAALTPLEREGALVGSVASELRRQAQASPETFLSTYYRTTVQQWLYDAWHDKGGVPGTDTTAALYRGDPSYTCFLDLTKLGELCKLDRIGSFTNKLKPTGKDWGLAAKSINPNTLKSAQALAEGLLTAQSNVQDPLTVTLEKTDVPLADLQADFLSTYTDTLTEISKDPKGKLYATIQGVQLRVKLSAAKKASDGIEAIASKLEGLTGELRAIDRDNEVKSAADWAAWLRTQIDELIAAAPAKRTDGSTTAKAKAPTQVTFWPILAKVDDTPLALSPKVALTFPTQGDPIGMEWWHFQRNDVVKSIKKFGDLLLELGWTNEGLLDTPSSETCGKTGVGYPQSELDKKVG